MQNWKVTPAEVFAASPLVPVMVINDLEQALPMAKALLDGGISVFDRAVALARFEQIVVEDLPDRVQNHKSSTLPLGGDDPSELVSMDEVEKRYILRVRTLARACAQAYYDARAALGFPMCKTAAAGQESTHAAG